MGRILNVLRRDDSPLVETEQGRNSPSIGIGEDAEPLLVETEEIPFIEVGPQKSLEASPSVLACPSAPTPPRQLSGQVNSSSNEISASVPSLRSVEFRAVSGRASRSSFSPELVAYHSPDQPAARQYRSVLDSVLNAGTATSQSAALLFTSSLPKSGATTTLLNLAITAARVYQQRLLVVDANFRRPAVSERLGLPDAPGLREAIAGSIAPDEAIQATELANFFVLPAGKRDTCGMRFVAETFRSLLRQLRQRYPLVMVDGPRWDGKPDVCALCAACDAVFLVTPELEAETPQTELLLRLIPQQGARLAGCILLNENSASH